jgi:hypothetical protein
MSKDRSVFDVNDYLLADDMLKAAPTQQTGQSGPPSKTRRLRARGERFTLVPEAWSDLLADAKSPATFKVALHLLHHNWAKNRASLVLANTTVKGVGRWEKWTALEELAARGLIKIERRGRKSPIVRLAR